MTTPNTFFSIVLLLFIVATILATIFLVKSCHRDSLPVFNPTVLQDSISSKEQQMGHIIDSLISRNNHMIGSADSLGAIIVAQEIELNVRKVITENLSDQYKAYRAKYDTVNALHKCDTLAEEVTRLNLAVMEYEDSNGKLYDSLQSITGINSLILAKKDYLYSTLRQSFDSLSNQYQIQSTSLQKASKPKHWAVGPQIGVSYDGAVRFLPAIGISYAIFKF